jgi:ribosomal-protein-serine acetyltransferase
MPSAPPFHFVHKSLGLEIRPLRIQDAKEVFSAIDADRAHLAPWLQWVDATKAPKDTRSYLRAMCLQARKGKALACGIWVRGAYAGTISLIHIGGPLPTAELGYYILSPFAGQGWMTHAGHHLILYAFRQLKLQRLNLYCRGSNKRSAAVAKRLGFKMEGRMRRAILVKGKREDRLVFGLLRGER